jgi:hypothetical protein
MTEQYKYDVAFSFLKQDLEIAQSLATNLEPGLRTFVYARRQEDLLGRDGMDVFAKVFGGDSRLSVILHRGPSGDGEGWGGTPWTAFEENHIKARALKTRMTNFMLVRLDAAEVPKWVPEFHIWSDWQRESRDAIVGAIRAKAREVGAAVRWETAIERAVRQKREREAEQRREWRRREPNGGAMLREQAQNVFAESRISLAVS